MDEEPDMKTMLLLLSLALGAQASVQFHEMWRGAREGKSGLAAWGNHHVWLAEGTGESPAEAGMPEGVLDVVEGEGAWWAVLKTGDLRRVGGAQEECWSLGKELLASAADEGRGLWLLEQTALTLVRLHAAGSPEALCRMALPPGEGVLRLRGGIGGSYLQKGRRLYIVRPGGWESLDAMPQDVVDWTPWRGEILLLRAGGLLSWLDMSRDSATVSSTPWEPAQLPQRLFTRLLRHADALWLQEDTGGWWRWRLDDSEARAVALTFPEGTPLSWLPAGSQCVVAQSNGERRWWRECQELWSALPPLPRPVELRARLVRQGGDWRLGTDGQLWQGRLGHWEDRGSHPGAAALLRGGTGPWLKLEGGLRVFSDGGAAIGGWKGPSEGAAAEQEDYLLVGGGDSLRVFWTAEEDPWHQATLPLGEVERISTSPMGAAVLAEGQVHWVDLERPWLPRLEGSAPAPEGLQDMLLVEDRLLLACAGGLKAWTMRNGQWETVSTALDGSVARWLCHRGADRVLALSERGVLSQWRLVDNLPAEVEWSQRIALTGRMSLERDSLRLLGDAGCGDWPLPAWQSGPPEEFGSRGGVLNPGTGGLRLRRTGRHLEVSTDRASGARAVVHDLLGRRVAEATLRAGSARLDLGALPAGTYIVQTGHGPGQTRLMCWRP